jgi:Holliday junction resolvase
MGRMSRQKGKRGEREAAAELGNVFGCPSRRGVQYQGGPDSPDVVLEGVNVHVECKRTESINVYKALEQASEDAAAGNVPIVWHRRNGKPSVLIVRVSDIALLAKAVCDSQELSNGGEHGSS